MADTSKDRVKTSQLTLVRATLPLLEAEQAYLEACQRWAELRERLPVADWPTGEELRTLGSNFKVLLGADDLAEASWAQMINADAEAVGALVAHAFEDARVQRVTAEASAHHVPTIRVLGKNAFRRIGPGRGPGSLLFQRDREATLGA